MKYLYMSFERLRSHTNDEIVVIFKLLWGKDYAYSYLYILQNLPWSLVFAR